MKNTVTISCLFMFIGLCAFGQETTYTGKEAIIINQKSTCGTLETGKVRYGMWEGRVWSRVPGEKDRLLFKVMGINTRHCNEKEDETKGHGYRSFSREVMFYMDPQSGEIMDTWENPWTGHTVEVVHVANDPVNMRAYSYENDEKGEPRSTSTLRKYGDITVSSHEIPLFYANPLGGEYQAYVGGVYHAMEIFNTYYQSKEITDPAVQSLTQSNISWSRVAQWLPWMEMGSRPGIMVFNATGFSTFDESEIWEPLKEALDERYPQYLTPPPLDDPRPNETSWTVFKKHMEGKEKAPVRR